VGPVGPVDVQPVASEGCGKASPVELGRGTVQTVPSGSLTRSYLLYVPTGYKETVRSPLVLNFHGHGSNALIQAYTTNFSQLAEQQNFIVVYPQGIKGPDRRTGWDTGPANDPRVSDLLFVSDMLNFLQAKLCIDPTRIYATGFSNGGAMTDLLACKMADRIAAFAPVSGSYPPVPGGCNPARPVPILEFHGTADHIVPYDGSYGKNYPPIPQWLQGWVVLDGCTTTPIITHPAPGVLKEQWMGCRGDASLIHYQLTGWPHAWPRPLLLKHGKVLNAPVDATPIIWSFFKQHPLPNGKQL
jgi:polyhydroxybutyrate depolymerase